MPVAKHITLEMLLTEMKRIRKHMTASYPDLVRNQKLTPWERDHRLSCNATLIEMLENTIHSQQQQNKHPQQTPTP